MYATFALQEQVGGRFEPSIQYWILEDDERWHDVVRGDGSSYRPGGPPAMEALPGESLEEFEKRVDAVVSEWKSHN